MSKQYIVINLNKAESAETRIERVKERGRWIIFSIIFDLGYVLEAKLLVREH